LLDTCLYRYRLSYVASSRSCVRLGMLFECLTHCSFQHLSNLLKKKGDDYRPAPSKTLLLIPRLLMIFPHAVFLSQRPVENLPRAYSWHFIILDKDNSFRDLITSNLAFAVT
jgi:hypothetical protein